VGFLLDRLSGRVRSMQEGEYCGLCCSVNLHVVFELRSFVLKRRVFDGSILDQQSERSAPALLSLKELVAYSKRFEKALQLRGGIERDIPECRAAIGYCIGVDLIHCFDIQVVVGVVRVNPVDSGCRKRTPVSFNPGFDRTDVLGSYSWLWHGVYSCLSSFPLFLIWKVSLSAYARTEGLPSGSLEERPLGFHIAVFRYAASADSSSVSVSLVLLNFSESWRSASFLSGLGPI
jgi:hypothetical protein